MAQMAYFQMLAGTGSPCLAASRTLTDMEASVTSLLLSPEGNGIHQHLAGVRPVRTRLHGPPSTPVASGSCSLIGSMSLGLAS